MKKLLFLFISILLLSLTFIAKGVHEVTFEKKTMELAQAYQLSESEEDIFHFDRYSFNYQAGADEGFTVPQGRRFGLNKSLKNYVFDRYHTSDGKNKPIKLTRTSDQRHFIKYLATRHSQGFYIYSLKELLL